VLQCVVVCCSVLQCVAVCGSVVQQAASHHRVAVCCTTSDLPCDGSVLQCAVRCSVSQYISATNQDRVAVLRIHHELHYVAAFCSVLQCVAVCCSVLQCVAVCCSVLQCVANISRA